MSDPLSNLRDFVQTFTNKTRNLDDLGGPILHYGGFLGTNFELNRESAISLKERDGCLPAARLQLPLEAPAGFAPFLTTSIQTFGETQVSDYQTQISIPIPLLQDGTPPLSFGDTLQFRYRLGENPGIIWEKTGPQN